MCQSKANGGTRCTINKPVANQRRRDRYAVKTAEQMIDQVIAEQGSEWTGDVDSIGLKISSPLIAKSYALAVKAHSGVKRKSGEVYLNHPLRVAQRLQAEGFNDEVIAVALLHDAVEDSPMTLSDLRRYGFSERVVSGVDSVTKRDGETYEQAIERARKHPIGRLVKLSDNLDNSSDEQLAPFTPERQARQRAKYTPARVILIRSIRMNPTESMMVDAPGFTKGYAIRLKTNTVETIFDGKE